jgi:FAD/FMN-containing dehydrogenase
LAKRFAFQENNVMTLSSWGNYPLVDNNPLYFDNTSVLKDVVALHDELIPYGNGRSYGDSALSKNIIHAKPYNYFISFDKANGLLHLQAGVLLSDIINVFVPRGWFLKITPGTKLITVGGAIACDVHGKNHHVAGCFSECVKMFKLMLPDGEVVNCSKAENIELFKATCGGMGLTGVILEAVISLKKINSKYIDQTTIKTNNLKETFAAFQKYKDKPYSVAWIDCLATGGDIGKCLLMVGDFSDDGQLDYKPKKNISVPFMFPSFVLNTFTVKVFNWLYFGKVNTAITNHKVDLDTFFYPLDFVAHWNRIYGKSGFTQYQFILPKKTSFAGLERILKEIAHSGRGSFLAVLKLYGPENDNYLSFPIEGYSLALDFKIDAGLFDFLNKLDEIVLQLEGRIYLAKDSRVSQAVFEQGYQHVEAFRALRKKHLMHEKFNSTQSRRIGI